jgi:Cft2 family RNA processing exonuclease
MRKYPIPEDLQVMMHIANDNRNAHIFTGVQVRNLIERTIAAEGRVAELEAENARLKAPVSDEEMASIWFHGRKDFFTQVMASRATAKEQI